MFRATGLMASMVTSFTKDMALDEKAIVQHIEFQRKAGIKKIVILGGTGEPVSLSVAERERVMELSHEACGEDIDVIASAMVGNPDEIIADIRRAARHGAKACMITTPPFVRPSANDVYRYLQHIAASSPLPLVLFNVPSRSGFLMSAELIEKAVKNIDLLVAIKESSRDLALFSEIRLRTPDNFACLQGVDSLYLPSLAIGGEGGILASTAVFPELTLGIEKAFNSNDLAEAKRLHFSLLPFLSLLFEQSHPAPLKHALEIRGVPSGPTRPPFYGIGDDLIARLTVSVQDLTKEVQDRR